MSPRRRPRSDADRDGAPALAPRARPRRREGRRRSSRSTRSARSAREASTSTRRAWATSIRRSPSSTRSGRPASAPRARTSRRWLAALREFFRHDVVALVQKDAIERKGLTQLLFEPETLPLPREERGARRHARRARGPRPRPGAGGRARRSCARSSTRCGRSSRPRCAPPSSAPCAATGRARSRSRATSTGSAPSAATSRAGTPSASASCRTASTSGRTSGSATSGTCQSSSTSRARWRESVVYSSIMAAIFASHRRAPDAPALLRHGDRRRHAAARRSGRGPLHRRSSAAAPTSTARSRTRRTHFIERPEKTLLLLISDLYEGGDRPRSSSRACAQLVDSRVKVVCLLALSDSGRPAYDHDIAAELGGWGSPASAARRSCCLQ